MPIKITCLQSPSRHRHIFWQCQLECAVCSPQSSWVRLRAHRVNDWITFLFFSAPSSRALLCVSTVWLISELFLMAPMLIRKVQTIAGSSMREGYLIPDPERYVPNWITELFPAFHAQLLILLLPTLTFLKTTCTYCWFWNNVFVYSDALIFLLCK